MLVTRKQTVSNKPVNWLLIFAVFVAALIPAHYHLHHLDSTGSSAHGHNIDLHLLSDNEGKLHHDIDATSFTAVPDDAVKSKSIITPIISLALVLAVLPVIQKQVGEL